ncbi:hypothetical protein C1H46_024539 [Malus baccata]|uniref:Uncharacterized protein n=1 Tax=Malus baccata TaxID=106549 RepID=A0A540LU27_MALBA|nr:hypothetical protein C1H46_024539 [Malus baccata]
MFGSCNGLVCIVPQPKSFSFSIPALQSPSKYQIAPSQFMFALNRDKGSRLSLHLLDSYGPYGGTFVNGALHWLCRLLGVGATYVIVVLDLAEENFL